MKTKKTKNLLTTVMLLAVAVMVSGCAGSRMNTKDMFMAEKVIGEPEEISYYRFILPEILDVPDTALVSFGNRVWPSLSWRAVFRVKKTDGKYDLIKTIATRDSLDMRNYLKINIPAYLQLKPDDQIFVVDHEQKYIFNALGGFISADYESVNLNQAEGFLTKVRDLKVVGLKKGTAEYESATEFSKRLIGTELIKAAEDVKGRLKLPLGCSLNNKQLALVEEKGYGKMFKELLFDHWYLAFAYPLISPETLAGYVFITKVFQVPIYWWREETGPGRLNRPLTAKDWYITNYWLSKRRSATVEDFFDGFKLEETVISAASMKAAKTVIPFGKMPLTAEQKAKSPCPGVETIDDFNDCASRYNAGVIERNAERRAKAAAKNAEAKK